MPTRLLRCLAVLAALLFLADPAQADPVARPDAGPTAADLKAARDLFMAAEKDEDAGRWADALDKLERVGAVRRTPGVRYHTALCEEQLGHLKAAIEDYKGASAQAHDENATDVLRSVDKRLADASERIPHITVVVAPSAPDATVLLDAQPVTPGTAVAVDAGEHKIEARAAGRVPAERTVTVVERDAISVQLPLDPIASPAPVVVAPPASSQGPSTPSPQAQRDRAVAIASTVAAVVLAGGGVAAYLVAGNKRSDGKAACAQALTEDAAACDPERNAVRTWDWIAVGAWAGAAVVATVATVGFVHLGHDGEARVAVGPTSVALRGTF
jgi:hypothetical protein